jgi:hypothetical protein
MIIRSRGALALIALLVGSAGQAAAETGSDQPEEAFCRSSTPAGCECSFRSLEAVLTFSEAAGVILIYYRDFPDERYSGLLERLLRQCADSDWRPAPAAQATIRQDQTAPASAPSKQFSRTSGARP